MGSSRPYSVDYRSACWGLLDYSSFGSANQIRPDIATARYYWGAFSRIDLFLNVVRLHWTVRGNSAGIVLAGVRMGTSRWHGSLRRRSRDTIFRSGAVPSLLAKVTSERQLAGASEDRRWFCNPRDDVQVPCERGPGPATPCAQPRAVPCDMVCSFS